jgi:DNA-binding transcriptional LysR family regulator
MSEMRLYCGAGHPLFEKSEASLTIEDIEGYPHAQRGYVSYDQLPEIERPFTYSARAPNIEGLAHLVLSGEYLAFLPTHYAAVFQKQGKIRSLMNDHYGYMSSYEIIRRKSAPRTPAEHKFHGLLLAESEELGLVDPNIETR